MLKLSYKFNRLVFVLAQCLLPHHLAHRVFAQARGLAQRLLPHHLAQAHHLAHGAQYPVGGASALCPVRSQWIVPSTQWRLCSVDSAQ